MDVTAERDLASRLTIPAGLIVSALGLVVLARLRPDWPWFSLWLLGLLAVVALGSIPRVRRATGLTGFRLTLVTITGVALFNLFLFHVETHRQRSERLEVEGVWFDANVDRIRIGVGEPDLDLRLAGSLLDFDRWSVDVRPVGPDRFTVGRPSQVDMLHVRQPPGSWRWRRARLPVLGQPLSAGRATPVPGSIAGDSLRLIVSRTGGAPLLAWGDATAPLVLDDPLLDRRLSARLREGIPLAELAWDTLPDRRRAEELVLTRTDAGRTLGRLRLALPRYRVTSRRPAEEGGAEPLVLAAGDTLWITSRGTRWAFALGRVAGVSRVAAPLAVRFVERPRIAGWPLPSGEACGRDADRCAVVSTRPLPPPQPHFDLSGVGLDTTRYALLARLESDGREVRLVGARETLAFPYGEVRPVAARAADPDDADAGLLLRVQRTPEGRQAGVSLTVLGLFALMVGALLVASGDPGIWRFRSSEHPHAAAAWGFLDLFVVFLGVRLALGLRVAYTPPFYERSAVTAVGLWIAFATLVAVLARWPAWSPVFFRWIRRLERPFGRLFLPGFAPAEEPVTSHRFTLAGREEAEAEARARARGRTLAGALLFVTALVGLLLQRPAAAAGLLVAGSVVAAWLAMGMARRRDGHWPLSPYPLRVVTADAESPRPALAFALTAGGSILLVLAMHAPLLALVPVVALLFLFGVDGVARIGKGTRTPARRGWIVAGTVVAGLLAAVLLFVGPVVEVAAGTGLVLAGGAFWLARVPRGGQEPRIETAQRGFDDLRAAVLSGVGWVGVLVVLGALVFLNSQSIPPFVRFGLVFALFLLAIRAGLACRRVLQDGTRRGRVEALALLTIPAGVLLVFMLFDFGLGLVFFVPMFLTVLLSARIDRLPRSLALAAVGIVAVVGLVAGSVLRPSLGPLEEAPDLASFDAEFRSVGGPVVDVLRAVGLSGPVTRATVRSMAASDPALLEQALAFAGPSEALVAAAPSLDQVWGGRAYAASGWTGTGFAGTVVLGRGVPTPVSFAENTFSVYVLSEHGALGGIAVLLAYLGLLAVAGVWIFRVHRSVQDTPLGLAVVALVVGGVTWLTLPAAYVAASNLGLVPLTGQNMPFLGLNSWADVVLVAGLATAVLSGLAALDGAEAPEAPPAWRGP